LPLHCSPSSLFLGQFKQILSFYFHIRIQNTCTIFTLPLYSTRKDLFYYLVLHFIKCILIVQGFFPDISSWDISCFNQIKPLLLFLYHHASLIFNSLQNSTLYYIHTYINISIFIYT
jgi:hypothetical protein